MSRSAVSQSGFDLQTVRVGTLNGPKLEAVRSALAAFSSELEVVGHEVESGVPDQPVGLKEIVVGARNRARAAYEKAPVISRSVSRTAWCRSPRLVPR